MLRASLEMSIACVLLLTLTSAAVAQPTMLPPPMHPAQEISVSASGSQEYVPDIARVTLGIRADSPSAATAVDTVNKNSNQVIASLRAAGVDPNAIKTVSFNLFFRPVTPGPGQPVGVSASASAQTQGSYEATEMLQVTVPVNIAGKVLDAGISAGANESFGLAYQTSNYDALYRAALAKAVASARSTAEALARAAHVTIANIQSISNSTEAQAMLGRAAAAPMALGAQILPGSDSVTATVFVVYRIR